MKTSEKIDLISKALVQAQKEIKPAIKDSKNPYFKSTYADLTAVVEAIKDPLNKNGVSFLQLVNSGEKDTVETILLHESGQFISTETKVYCTKPNDPQAFGGGITYTKRYALQAALGLPTEDDDGNSASGKTGKQNGVEGLKQAIKSEPKAEGLSAKQLEFCEKVKITLEENSDGRPVNFQTVKSLIAAMAKTSKAGKVPTDADSDTINKTASVLLTNHHNEIFTV